MHADEKWLDQDGKYNRQNDCIYAESRETVNAAFDTIPMHKFRFKDMVWAGITFNLVTEIEILSQIRSFYEVFTSQTFL